MAIDDQAYKDALKAIEAGDIPEDLDLPDPEDYDDMGGIKSLDRDAPSIKMASEPGDDEAVIEIGQMLEAYEDAVKNGYEGDIKEFSEYYFGQMKMDQDRQMAMNGGRMKYGEGTPDKRGNPAVMTEIENMREFKRMNPDVEDVTDYKTKYLKLKAQDEEIKRMLDKAKKDKEKRAKGGIAGVL